jgi:hypothetical protein
MQSIVISLFSFQATFFTITDQVFFDITIGDEKAGRIVIGLFGGYTTGF